MLRVGVFVGRCQPFHKGHEQIIRQMLHERGTERCVILLGSINAPLSAKNPFPYPTRYQWVKNTFQYVHVLGIPDFPDNDDYWLFHIMQVLKLPYVESVDPYFYVGSERDGRVYHERGFTTMIVPRSKQYSGTEIRRRLAAGEDFSELVSDPEYAQSVKSVWDTVKHAI